MNKITLKTLFPRLVIIIFMLGFLFHLLFWSVKRKETLLFIVALLVTFLFLQYLILNVIYPVQKPNATLRNNELFIKVGNLEIQTQIKNLRKANFEGRKNYYLFSQANCTLRNYPVLAFLLVPYPPLFTFTYLAYYSYPLLFKDQKDLEAYFNFNEGLFGEKVVLSEEIMKLTGFNLPS